MTTKPAIKNLVELDTVGSTNDHAKNLARNGYPHGTAIWAHEQTAGRGRQGNQWISPRGNLYMTVILRPQKNAALTGQLSFVAAVALAETLRGFLPNSVQISVKWPNDILLNGQKAAGILLETETQGVRDVPWVIIGMGVNVAHAPEGAASLAHLGAGADTGTVLEKLHLQLMNLYDVWVKKGFGPIRDSWMQQAHNIGNVINIRLPNEIFSAKFLGIDTSGALQVELDDGRRRDIASGEVFAA